VGNGMTDFTASFSTMSQRLAQPGGDVAAGEDALREAIASVETKSTGRRFERDQIVVFPGATAALYSVFACILNPGDGVLVPEPMYIGYHGVFDAIGAEIQTVGLDPRDFSLDVDALLAAVAPNTRAVLVNTPGNPCGNLIEPGQLRQLAAECARRNLWLVCDEVYSLITFDRPHVSLLNCTEDLSNIVVIDGLSKSHAMTGWRVGWTVADLPMTEALINLSGSAFFGVEVEHMRRAYESRRDYVVSRVKTIPGLDCFVPPAGMFVMLDGSQLYAASSTPAGDRLAARLLADAGISTIPGSGFGPSAANYVRLSLTVEQATLARAFDRIAKLFT